jgi:hypothetical protein
MSVAEKTAYSFKIPFKLGNGTFDFVKLSTDTLNGSTITLSSPNGTARFTPQSLLTATLMLMRMDESAEAAVPKSVSTMTNVRQTVSAFGAPGEASDLANIVGARALNRTGVLPTLFFFAVLFCVANRVAVMTYIAEFGDNYANGGRACANSAKWAASPLWAPDFKTQTKASSDCIESWNMLANFMFGSINMILAVGTKVSMIVYKQAKSPESKAKAFRAIEFFGIAGLMCTTIAAAAATSKTGIDPAVASSLLTGLFSVTRMDVGDVEGIEKARQDPTSVFNEAVAMTGSGPPPTKYLKPPKKKWTEAQWKNNTDSGNAIFQESDGTRFRWTTFRYYRMGDEGKYPVE